VIATSGYRAISSTTEKIISKIGFLMLKDRPRQVKVAKKFADSATHAKPIYIRKKGLFIQYLVLVTLKVVVSLKSGKLDLLKWLMKWPSTRKVAHCKVAITNILGLL
jgi:hypothetical protein